MPPYVPLELAETHFRTLVEQVPTVMYTDALDDAATPLYVSPQIETLLGYSPQEWTADPDLWLRCVHPEDRERAQQAVQRLTVTGKPLSIDYRMYTRAGALLWVHDETRVVRDAQGAPLYAQGFITDITARKQAEAALRESEERFHSLFEKHDAVMLLVEPHSGQILDANLAAEKYYGYPQQQLQAMNIEEINVLPREEVAAVRLAALEQKRNCFVSPHRLANGAIRTVEVHSSPILMHGKTILFSILHDITERTQIQEQLRASETRYRDLVESASDMLYRTDARGYFTYANPVAVRQMHFASESDFVGRHFTELMQPDARRAAQKFYDEQFRLRIPNTYYEFPARTADGAEIWLGQNVQILMQRDEVLGFQAVARDITARKQAEAELQAQRDFALQIMNAMGQGLTVTDSEGRFEFVNAAFAEIVGGAPDRLVGASVLDLFWAEDHETVAQARAAVLAGATTAEEVRLKRADGSAAYALVTRVPRRRGDQITGIIAVVTDLSERRRVEQRQAAQYAVTRILSEAATLDQAAAPLLATICTRLDWALAEMWLVDRETDRLRLAHNWQAPEMDVTQFEADAHYLAFARGHGQPGWVWASGEPLWTPDVTRDSEFVQKEAANRAGLHGSFAFPIHLGGEVLGVLVFFSQHVRPPDPDLFSMMAAIGSQIGQFVERKRAEQALRENREQLNSILASLQDVVWAASMPDFRFLFLNPAAERVFGRTVAEFIENPSLWLKVVHPDDRVAVSRKQAEAAKTGTVEVEYRILRPNGEERWLLSRMRVARDAGGVPLRVDGIATDITERKRAQQELRAQRDFALQVMSTMGQGLTVTNAQGKFEYVNPAYARMVGLSAVALIGKSPFDVTDPESHPALVEAWEHRLAGKMTTYETRLKHADGHLIPVLITSTPRWREGQVGGSIAVITDLTAQKHLEGELARARDQALEGSRLKSEFLAMMSHEIRTPMNSIVGMTELLLDTSLDDEQRDFARIAHDSSHVLLNIINDILDLTKIEAGKLVLERAEFDLTNCVEGAAEIVSPRAREKQLPLMTFIDPALPQMVIGDNGRLRQVLLNLLSNALKFTERGHVTLRAGLWQDNETDILVKFQVRDTGIGISPETQARLFQPFTQADGSITRRYGGTGLGLAISKRIVEMMDGEIGVTSAVGEGSNFWFVVRLERAPTREKHSDLQLPIPRLRSGQASNFQLRVLIVDDHPEHGMILHSYLDSWKIPNTTVTDGDAALQALRDAHQQGAAFAVALLDLHMPAMNGFALAHQVHSQPELKNLGLILVTAYDTPGLGEEAIAKGFAAYLTKPLRQSQLLEAILHAASMREPARVTAPVQPVRPVAPAATGSKHTILVVEDDAANQKMAELQLRFLGYGVEIVGDGARALETLQVAVENQRDYALVLMDCQMPVMDGFSATREIRRRETHSGAHAIIIAMTANAMQGDREACFAAGMDDYISKPVQIEALKQVLAKWLLNPS